MTAATGGETLARCVEEFLGATSGSAPEDRDRLNEWLATRRLILVPVASPESFVMAGTFFARYERGWVIAFGAPPGPIWDPTDMGDGATTMLEAAVMAPLEMRRSELDRAAASPTSSGRVDAIAIAAAAEGPMRLVESARALAGRGLEGDRYGAGEGTFWSKEGSGTALTLIEAEALEGLRASGIDLNPADVRRNLVVSGIELDGLIGRRFRVGGVECLGSRRCEPCSHLQRLTGPGVLRGLVHRGGLRADLLSGGEIRVGDEVAALE